MTSVGQVSQGAAALVVFFEVPPDHEKGCADAGVG